MRINLSNYWRKNDLIIICLIFLILGGTTTFCIWSADKEDIVLILLMALLVIILLGVLIFSNRLLAYSILEQNKVSAYTFFNKPMCEVSTTKPVFYSIFLSPQGTFVTTKMIAISNEPFECRQNITKMNEKKFIMIYDQSKVIVLPYEEQVNSLLQLEQWHQII